MYFGQWRMCMNQNKVQLYVYKKYILMKYMILYIINLKLVLGRKNDF